MNDKQTNKIDTKGEEDNKTSETSEKTLNIVEEARAIRDEIIQQKEELQKEKEELSKLQSENLLSGTTGGQFQEKPEEISPEEYSKKALSGDIDEKKDE